MYASCMHVFGTAEVVFCGVLFPVRFNIKYRNADIQTYTYFSSVIRKYPFHINNFSI